MQPLSVSFVQIVSFSSHLSHNVKTRPHPSPAIQELDSEYLIIWDGFEGKPWAYRGSAGQGLGHYPLDWRSSNAAGQVCWNFSRPGFRMATVFP